jgi:FAD/FMN-containing dehydrogenase
MYKLFVVLLASRLALAAPSAATQTACNEIKQALPGKVWFPDEPAYTKENKDYYNSGLADLRPACITMPTSAQEVSTIVKILNTHDTVNFAVKSGGHSPNAGAASIKDGVLIAMRNVSGTEFDKEKQLAYVKPGGHWTDVLKALNGTGRMVVGGRLGVVGIGGYLLQGGVSFLSGQYGMGCDVRTNSILIWPKTDQNY